MTGNRVDVMARREYRNTIIIKKIDVDPIWVTGPHEEILSQHKLLAKSLSDCENAQADLGIFSCIGVQEKLLAKTIIRLRKCED